MKYTYTITVEKKPVEGKTAEGPMLFEAGSHDDVSDLLDRARQQGAFDEATRCALVVGAKLLGSAVLSNRDSVSMAKLMPHFKALMKELKRSLSGEL
ncbi:DUF3861 family protein [Pseudodesulfovibrio sp. JC047]|uniref:DUF3861 family protein n=1 Tax=Pseudodesulfovibrio sp. JC047 TaxID=2683199 RepID=UPI0013D22EAD|nr:DUF3861 family protein [Pseudodesulfovibrio sp. JC047]NDV18403.1 DUF3861 family protein [Pseudodesulfovibrio sp. JC047]